MDRGSGSLAGQTRLQRIRHLRRSPVTVTYLAYYNSERVHTGLGESPDGRPVEARPSPTGRVVGLPRLGGLHHRYVWAESA
jgi:hypothetical protein